MQEIGTDGPQGRRRRQGIYIDLVTHALVNFAVRLATLRWGRRVTQDEIIRLAVRDWLRRNGGTDPTQTERYPSWFSAFHPHFNRSNTNVR